jgi:hypothetical protein
VIALFATTFKPNFSSSCSVRYEGDKEIWPFVSILGLVIFNWPLLEIFREEIASYLYLLWAVFIILLAFVTRSRDVAKKDT